METYLYKISSNNIRRINTKYNNTYMTSSFLQDNMVILNDKKIQFNVPTYMIVEKTGEGLVEYLTRTLIIDVKDFDNFKSGVFYCKDDSLYENFNIYKEVDVNKLLIPVTSDEAIDYIYSYPAEELIEMNRRLLIFADKAMDVKQEYFNKEKIR